MSLSHILTYTHEGSCLLDETPDRGNESLYMFFFNRLAPQRSADMQRDG